MFIHKLEYELIKKIILINFSVKLNEISKKNLSKKLQVN